MMNLKRFFATIIMSLALNALCSMLVIANTIPDDGPGEDKRRDLFKDTVDYLSDAVTAFDRHDQLSDWHWFSIGTNKEENAGNINKLLDKALEVLAISEVTDTRLKIRDAEKTIVDLQRDIDEYNLEKVSAKPESSLGAAEKLYRKSKEDYEAKIRDANSKIEGRKKFIEEQKTAFLNQLKKIGVDIDEDSADTLLSTVSGSDLVDMCVVFDNIKYMTIQLEKLTEESNESGDAARRYYGMYVMLIRIMDRIQKSFIDSIEKNYIPKLGKFSTAADRNIAEAKRNMRAGGNMDIGANNIRVNELTMTVVKEYSRHLRVQASLIKSRNANTQRDLKDALNTYNSVKLSANVAAMLRAGRKNFAAVSRLRIPDLRLFQSKELREEFDRLTMEMIEEGR